MTPEKQRIAIAEACGWKFRPLFPPPESEQRDHHEAKENAIMCWVRPENNDWETQELPDYLNDLNAIQEAETCLDFVKKGPKYLLLLEQIISRRVGEDISIKITSVGQFGFSGWIAHAKAYEKAEAILKTIGKWEES